MKTFYTIGDTHGLGLKNFQLNLKKLVKDPTNMIIFVGDYCDSFTIDNKYHINSLKEIIEFKKKNPDNVILLLGNHDIAYWYKTYPYTFISGYRTSYAQEMHEIFKTDSELFQLAYQHGNYLWTHAGVNSYWFDNIFIASIEEKNTTDIADLLNRQFIINNPSLFVVGIPIAYDTPNNQKFICVDVYGSLQLEYEKANYRKYIMNSWLDLPNDTVSKKTKKTGIAEFKIPKTAIYELKNV